MTIDKYDLDNIFTFHKLAHDSQLDFYLRARTLTKELAAYVLNNTPASREQSLFMTKLEEASMWANAAAARNGWFYKDEAAEPDS